MLPTSLIRNPSRGSYAPLSDAQDPKNDNEHRSGIAVTPSKEISLQWLYRTLSAFTGFVVAIVMVNIFPGAVSSPAPTYPYGNAKLGRLLRMPEATIVFKPQEIFQHKPTKESDTAWEALLGPSIGLISLNNSRSYGLPSGANANNDESGSVYQLSVVHQIQCLYLIRKVYFGGSSGIFNTSSDPPSPFIEHTNHCFDYLLQSIRCNADMSLESKTDEGGNFIGWGSEHVCSNWDSVVDFMKKYKYEEAEKATDHHHHDEEDDDDHEH